MPKVLEEPYNLNDDDGNITEADGTASTWSDIWKWQCPQGVSLLMQSKDTISAYIEDASAEIAAPDAQVKVEIRDPSEQDKRPIYGPAMYLRSAEFSDSETKAHLNIPAGGLVVKPRDWVVVVVNDGGTIDASDSYFNLATTRIREAVV